MNVVIGGDMRTNETNDTYCSINGRFDRKFIIYDLYNLYRHSWVVIMRLIIQFIADSSNSNEYSAHHIVCTTE